MASLPDWTSKPVKLFKYPSEANHASGHLDNILPKSLCDGGVCDGTMPNCQKKKVAPIEIPKIVFKLSRVYKWRRHVGPKMRHIVAYALALSPSMIKIGEKQASMQSSTVDRRLSTDDVGVWVVELPADAEGEEDDFDTFSAEITEPMDYEITPEFLQTLLDRGAFHGLQDGRESTHGPVDIVGIELRPAAVRHDENMHALYESHQEKGLHHSLFRLYHRGNAAKVLAVALIFSFVGVLLLWSLRYRGYTRVLPLEVTPNTRELALTPC